MRQVKGEAAFDAFVELIDPIYEVSQDEELIRLVFDEKVSITKWLSEAIKRHKETFMKTLALLTDQDVDDMDFLSVYNGASKLMSNSGLAHLFLPQSRRSATSGSVLESTGDQET